MSPLGLNGFDRLDAWHLLLQIVLYPPFEGHLGHWAARAGSLELDLDDAVLYSNKLDISAVYLKVRANFIEGFCDLCFQIHTSLKGIKLQYINLHRCECTSY